MCANFDPDFTLSPSVLYDVINTYYAQLSNNLAGCCDTTIRSYSLPQQAGGGADVTAESATADDSTSEQDNSDDDDVTTAVYGSDEDTKKNDGHLNIHFLYNSIITVH